MVSADLVQTRLIPARFAMARVDQGVAPSGLGLQRERDQASDLLVPDLTRSPRAGRVRPSLQPMRRKAGPPRGHARTADLELARHPRVGRTRLRSQASTMRARWTRAWPALRRRIILSSSVRSSSLK